VTVTLSKTTLPHDFSLSKESWCKSEYMSVNPPSHLCKCTVDHCWAAWAILKSPNTVETANQLLTVKFLLYQGKSFITLLRD